MKTKKFILLAALICCFGAGVANGQTTVASGTCGDNLTWVLTSDSTLTISGSGKMWHYPTTNVPWYSYRNMIKTLVIGESVTSIYDYAFLDCRGLTSVTIGYVTTIKHSSGLTWVNIGYPGILNYVRRDKIILTDEAYRYFEEAYRNLKEYKYIGKELYVCSKKDSYLIIQPIISDTIIVSYGYKYPNSYGDARNYNRVESKSGDALSYDYFTTDFRSLLELKDDKWWGNVVLTTQSTLNDLQAYYNNTGKTSAFQKEYNSWKQRLIKDYGQNYGTKIANGILETGMTKSMVKSMKKYYYEFKGSNTIVQGDVEYYEIQTLTTPSKYISKVSARKMLKFLNGKLIKIEPAKK
jgi:hypothetical protein